MEWVDPLGLAPAQHDWKNKPKRNGDTASKRKKCHENYVDDPVKAESLNPKDIRYMQSSIKNTTGEHTVVGNAQALSTGSLKPENLTTIKVWKDTEGNIWSLDHRRLAAFKESGIESIPVEWASKSEVKNQSCKMSTKTNGENIKLKFGEGNNKIIG